MIEYSTKWCWKGMLLPKMKIQEGKSTIIRFQRSHFKQHYYEPMMIHEHVKNCESECVCELNFASNLP